MVPFDKGEQESCYVDDYVGMVADWFVVGMVRTLVIGAVFERVSQLTW